MGNAFPWRNIGYKPIYLSIIVRNAITVSNSGISSKAVRPKENCSKLHHNQCKRLYILMENLLLLKTHDSLQFRLKSSKQTIHSNKAMNQPWLHYNMNCRKRVQLAYFVNLKVQFCQGLFKAAQNISGMTCAVGLFINLSDNAKMHLIYDKKKH